MYLGDLVSDGLLRFLNSKLNLNVWMSESCYLSDYGSQISKSSIKKILIPNHQQNTLHRLSFKVEFERMDV